MLERRPLWGLIVLLNVCVVIWRMQEPAMLNVDYVDTGTNTDGQTNAQQQKRETYYSEEHARELARERLKRERQQLTEWQKSIAARNSIAQQLYAGKHLLAESAEANEIAARVTRYADDSAHTSISYYGSGSGSSRSTSTSRSKLKRKKWSKLKSTPTFPLVTAATLRNSAELHATPKTTTTSTPLAQDMRTFFNLPPHDQKQLIDLHDFTYLINQRGCSRDIQALILVHSAPGNEEKRRLIRDTWGNTDILPKIEGVMPLRLIFLLGTVATEAQQLDLERENFENGDLIQGSFVDSYRNMTYKHVMAFKWFLYNCAHAQILIKVDDDVYVNTPQLLIYLQRAMWSEEEVRKSGKYNSNNSQSKNALENAILENSSRFSTILENSSRLNSRKMAPKNTILENSSRFSSSASTVPNANATISAPPHFIAAHMLFRHPQNLLFCKTNINAQVKRSFRSKWRVTKREHAGNLYPPYCPGFAIIYSTDVVLRLYQAAQLSKYFWIDDVHITGILAQNLNITITNAQRDILYEDECDNLVSGVLGSEDADFLYAWHLIQPEQIVKLWQLYLDKARRHLSALHSTAKKTSSSSSYDPTEFNKFKNYR